MNSLRPVLHPTSPFGPSAALSATAVAVYAPAALVRGGPAQRAANLAARGVAVPDAARIAARQGKGHVAELAQAAEYSARAGVLGRAYHARPNPRANDPRVDIELRRGGRRAVAGAQVKVGSPRYVLRAARSGNYNMLVVNSEAREAIAYEEGIDLEDRLSYRGNAAGSLSAADCEERATATIARMLCDEVTHDWMDTIVTCAMAGKRAALETLAVGVLGDLVHAAWSGVTVDLALSIRAASHAAARSGARSAVHSYLLVDRFIAQARRRFSDRLLHRIAGSALVLGAFADVVVETSIDLVRVLRGEMTFDDLLRSFGVHVCTAGGGAVGILVAGLLTGGAAWWVQGLAVLAGGALGAYGGREIGSAVFKPPALPPRSLHSTKSW